MSTQELRKVLLHFGWICHEHPGLLLSFLPGGIMTIKGESPSPIRHEWSIIHNGNECILSVSPHLIEGHGEFKTLSIKDYLTLTSVKDEEQVLHLTRLKLKAI